MKIFWGALGVAGIVASFVWLQAARVVELRGGLFLIGAAFPGALLLMGLLEVMTGVPIHRLESGWASLAGWQRGIVGLLVVTAAFAVAVAGLVIFAG